MAIYIYNRSVHTSNVNFGFQRLMEQLIVNKPSDPLAFLVEQLKKENDDGMYIKFMYMCLSEFGCIYIYRTD